MSLLPNKSSAAERLGCYQPTGTPYRSTPSGWDTGNMPYSGLHPCGGLEALSTPQDTSGRSLQVERTPNSTSLQHARMHEGHIPSIPYARDSQEPIDPVFSGLPHSHPSPDPFTVSEEYPEPPLNYYGVFSESLREALNHRKGQSDLYLDGVHTALNFYANSDVEPWIGAYCEVFHCSPFPNDVGLPSDLHMDNRYCPTPPIPSHLANIPTAGAPVPGTPVRCQWDGCTIELDDISHGGLRRHFRDRHFRPRGTLTRCVWGQNCRSEQMLFENIPKHIAECHLKSMKQVCPGCHGIFARKDTLKRHITSGCPSGYQGPVQ